MPVRNDPLVGQTVDLPDPASAPDPSSPEQRPARATVRAEETKVESQANHQAGLVTADIGQAGVHTPKSDEMDPSAMTGGYIPKEPAESSVPGTPSVQGYEILGELGRGGMGVVYKARQMGLDRLVALKMILAGAHARPKDLERFRAEAQAVARFQHPNLVQIYEVGESAGLPYFSLEFVEGGTLAGRTDHDPQTPAFAAATIEALARAMQYAHDRGVIHRDLKPANVLMTTDGTPKVTDFGLAKRLEQDSGQTQAGTILGTPSYMAPEQAMGDTDKVGPAADVYALGAMLYDLLTGRPPFAGSSVLDTLEMVRKREPVPPGSLTAKLPRDLETICLKCLHKEAERRYASAGDLADDLRRFLEGRPILARPVSLAERSWRWAKRNPTVASLSSATALLIVAVAIITSVMSYNLNVKKNEALSNLRAAQLAEEKEAEQKQVAIVARAKAEKADKVRGEQTNLALDTVRGISQDVDAVLGTKQSLAPLRTAIQKKMLSDVDRIRDHAAKNALEDRGEATALAKLGDIYLQANRVQDAAKNYKRVRDIFDQFVKDHKDDPVGPRNLAAALNKLGDAEVRLGNTAEGRDDYAAALERRKKWAGMVPGHADAMQSIAESYTLLGRVNLELGEPAAALENFQAAEREYSLLPGSITGRANVQLARLAIREQRAGCLYKLGQTSDAEKEYQAVMKVREASVQKHPNEPFYRKAVALTRLSVGDFYLFDRKDALRAFLEYQPAYREVSDQAKADPDDLDSKRQLSGLAYRMGVTVGRLAAGPVLHMLAISYYLECLAARRDLAKVDRKDTQGQIDLMVILGRLGRSAEAEAIAKGLLAQAGKDRRVLFQCACGLALGAGGVGTAADHCRTQAFKVLGDLVEQGWKDRIALETDPDLDPIRGDKRFGELLTLLRRP